MKVLVIGCGSIGQRHIRNLLKVGSVEILAFDFDKKRCQQVRRLSPKIKASLILDQLWKENPKIAFITTPTSLHLNYATMAAKRGCHLFIEKPLANEIEGIKTLLTTVKKKKLISLVGCNMRFYWAIAKIKQLLMDNSIGRVISAQIAAGQYLPDWHPEEDYRKTYSAKSELGGGVILDAIHEIDYSIWFFGQVEKIVAMYGKLSSLEIETEDNAEIIAKFKKGPLVNIHVDYLQHPYGRSCKLIGEKGTIDWDISQKKVKLYSAKTKKYKAFLQPRKYDFNWMYLDEIKYFLNCVKRGKNTFNDVFSGFETLATALRVKNNGIEIKNYPDSSRGFTK